MPYAVRSRSPLVELARPCCVKCGAPMLLANRRPATSCGYRYERWKFECAKCRNVQTYTMGSTTRHFPEKRVVANAEMVAGLPSEDVAPEESESAVNRIGKRAKRARN